MAIYVEFHLEPTELTCWYDGELDKEHWSVIKKAIDEKSVRLSFSHRPSLIGLEVPISAIYEGGADIEIKSEGLISISARGKAKIDGSAKAIKEIESDNPSDMAFGGLRAINGDGGFGAMSIVDGVDEVDATVRVNAKKI